LAWFRCVFLSAIHFSHHPAPMPAKSKKSDASKLSKAKPAVPLFDGSTPAIASVQSTPSKQPAKQQGTKRKAETAKAPAAAKKAVKKTTAKKSSDLSESEYSESDFSELSDINTTDDDFSGSDMDDEFSDIETEEAGFDEEKMKALLPVATKAKEKIEAKKAAKAKAGPKAPQQKKEESKVEEVDESRGVVYLGHIPYGFFETQMRPFFEQFGTVTRLRLARNKKTGNSKHFAFIEFEDKEVAEIVADTMNGYMMFGHTLVCIVLPQEQVHAEMFKGADQKFRKIPWRRIAKQRHNAPRTAEQQERRVKRLLAKEQKKREQLQALGIEYHFKGYSGEMPAKPVHKKL